MNNDAYRQSTLWDTWAEDFDDFNSVLDPAPAVDFLVSICPAGVFLELGIGTGRIAIELASENRSVHGIDVSRNLLAVLEFKKGAKKVTASLGDMADFEVSERFDVVYTACSSIFHVTEQERQLKCLQCAARALKTGGYFIVETFMPSSAFLSPNRKIKLRSLNDTSASLTAVTTNLATQKIHYQELLLSEQGVKCLPVEQRFIWPAELDLMATAAGLSLVDRFGSYYRAPFTQKSSHQICVYRNLLTTLHHSISLTWQ